MLAQGLFFVLIVARGRSSCVVGCVLAEVKEECREVFAYFTSFKNSISRVELELDTRYRF